MLVAKLLPFCKNLATRKWTDEEILDDVVYLRDLLQQNFESLSYVQFSFLICLSYELTSQLVVLTTSIRPNWRLDISLGPQCMSPNHFGKRMQLD